MATQQSLIRHTFFRGIYEVLSYLFPGLLLLYLFFVIFSILSRGWDEYLIILVEIPTILQNNVVAISGILIIAYLIGHLSWPVRWLSRRIWYGRSSTLDRIYSTLDMYFDVEINDTRLHEEVILGMEEFTGIRDIPKLSDDSIQRRQYTGGYLPQSEIIARSTSSEPKLREAYRIVRKFLAYNYPEAYHRGYERHSGLRRFWENIFPIGVTFTMISIIALFYSTQPVTVGVVVFATSLISLTAIYRMRVRILSPYRELFVLFILYQMGYLSIPTESDRRMLE